MNVRDEFTVDVYFGEERRNSYRFRRKKAPKGREQFVETEIGRASCRERV